MAVATAEPRKARREESFVNMQRHFVHYERGIVYNAGAMERGSEPDRRLADVDRTARTAHSACALQPMWASECPGD